jgi:hypothetical protein
MQEIVISREALNKGEYHKAVVVAEYPSPKDVTTKQVARLIVDHARKSGKLDEIMAGNWKKSG